MAGSLRPTQSGSVCESNPHRIAIRLMIRLIIRERHKRVESGYFDRSLNVYGQAGRPCVRCAAEGHQSLIVKDRFMNRSSAYCPRCQPVPRRARW